MVFIDNINSVDEKQKKNSRRHSASNKHFKWGKYISLKKGIKLTAFVNYSICENAFDSV